jgi:hypothetical protein
VSELTIPERVAAGAAWLDAAMPNWIDKVDLDTLDVGSDCRCILGQTFGHYQRSPEDARWSVPDGMTYLAADRGFNVDNNPDDEAETAEFAELTAEWRRVIESRRAGAVS